MIVNGMRARYVGAAWATRRPRTGWPGRRQRGRVRSLAQRLTEHARTADRDVFHSRLGEPGVVGTGDDQ
jgi:hypothetical protein